MMNISVGETLRSTRVVEEGVEPRTEVQYVWLWTQRDSNKVKVDSFNTDKTRCDKRNNKSLCSKEREEKEEKEDGRTIWIEKEKEKKREREEKT